MSNFVGRRRKAAADPSSFFVVFDLAICEIDGAVEEFQWRPAAILEAKYSGNLKLCSLEAAESLNFPNLHLFPYGSESSFCLMQRFYAFSKASPILGAAAAAFLLRPTKLLIFYYFIMNASL